MGSSKKQNTRTSFVALLGGLITAVIIAVASLALLAAVGINNFQATQQPAATTPAITVSAEKGSVEETVDVKVHSLRDASVTLTGTSLGAGVVTSPPLPVGSTIKEGDSILSINEKPVLIIQGETPAYRPLGPGLKGDDVTQLQEFLVRENFKHWDKKGVFGASTALALAKFYKERNLPVVNENGEPTTSLRQAGLPLSRYFFAKSLPLEIAEDCGPAGQQAADFKCVLQSSATSTVISSSADRDLQGMPVLLTSVSGQPVAATVGQPTVKQQATGPKEADAAQEAAQPATERWFSLTGLPKDSAEFAENARVVVQTSAKDGLRIPATAIHEDANGQSFLQSASKTDSGEKATTNHPVNVLFCANSYCAIEGEKLAAGMEFSVLE